MFDKPKDNKGPSEGFFNLKLPTLNTDLSNLFKRSPKKSEKKIIEPFHIHIEGGPSLSYTHSLIAKGIPNSVRKSGKFKWYSISNDGQFKLIENISSDRYKPSTSDISYRICCQWTPYNGTPSNFASIGLFIFKNDEMLGPLIDNVVNSSSSPRKEDDHSKALLEEISDLKSKNELLEKTIEAAELNKDKMRKEIDVLNKEAKLSISSGDTLLVTRLERVENEFKDLSERYISLEKLYKLSENRINTLTNERNSALSELDSLRNGFSKINEELISIGARESETRSQYATLELSVTNLNTTIEGLKDEKEDLLTRLNTLSSVNKQLNNQMNELQLRYNDGSTNERKMSEELNRMKSLHFDSEKDSKQLQIVMEERRALRRELDSLGDAMARLVRTNASLEQERGFLKEKLSKCVTVPNEDEVVSKKSEIEIENVNLQNELVSVRTKVAEMENTLLECNATLKKEHLESVTLSERNAELNAQLSSISSDHDEMVAQRNFYKKKADSLVHDMDKLLNTSKNLSSIAFNRNNASRNGYSKSNSEQRELEHRTVELTNQLEEMQKSRENAMRALDAYKKAFEQQFQRSKKLSLQTRLLEADSKIQDVSHYRKRGYELQLLANQLQEDIAEKDEVIEQMRHVSKMLGARVKELEIQLSLNTSESHLP